MDGFIKLLNDVAVLTEVNNHNGARAKIAYWYNFDVYYRFFKSLCDFDCMTTELISARESVTKEMLGKIAAIDGQDAANSILERL